MATQSSVRIGGLTFASTGQSVFTEGSGIISKIFGDTVEFGGALDESFGLGSIDASMNVELGAEIGLIMTLGALDSQFDYDVGATFLTAPSATDGSFVQFFNGTETLVRSEFASTGINMSAYFDLLFAADASLDLDLFGFNVVPPTSFDTRTLPFSNHADTYGEYGTTIGKMRLLELTPNQFGFVENIFSPIYSTSAVSLWNPGTAFLFSEPTGNLTMTFTGNFATPNLAVDINGASVQDFPKDENGKDLKPEGLADDVKIELAKIVIVPPTGVAPAAVGIRMPGSEEISSISGNTISGSATKNAVSATFDVDGVITYSLWHTAKIPIPLEIKFDDSIKLVVADIDAGVDLRMRQDLALTADDLDVTLIFFDEATGARTSIGIKDETGEYTATSWTGKWENLPQFRVETPTLIVPEYRTGGSLVNETGIEFGFKLTAELMKLSYNLPIKNADYATPSGALGPVARLEVTEQDVFSILESLGGPDLSDSLFLRLFDTTDNPIDVGGFDAQQFDASRLGGFLIDVNDGSGTFDPGRSGIISGRNAHAPTAVDDGAAGDTPYRMRELDTLTIALRDLMVNDFDADAYDRLAIRSVSSDTRGVSVALDGDGSVVVSVDNLEDLNAGEIRHVTFDYELNDDRRQTDTGTVTVEVTGVNRPPEASDDLYQLFRPIGLTSVQPATYSRSLLANDLDPDGDTLSVAPQTLQILHRDLGYGFEPDKVWATIEVAADGTFQVLQPPVGPGDSVSFALWSTLGRIVDYSFDYTAVDGSGETSRGTATIAIGGYDRLETGDTRPDSDGPDGPALIRSDRVDGSTSDYLYFDDGVSGYNARNILVLEGSTTEAYVLLTEPPDREQVRVTIAPQPGLTFNGDSEGLVLLFDPSNWDIPQPFTIHGVPDPGSNGSRDIALDYTVERIISTGKVVETTPLSVPVRLNDATEISVGFGLRGLPPGVWFDPDARTLKMPEGTVAELSLMLSNLFAGFFDGFVEVDIDVTSEVGALAVREVGGDTKLSISPAEPVSLFEVRTFEDDPDPAPWSAEITFTVDESNRFNNSPYFFNVDPYVLTLEVYENRDLAPIAVDDEIMAFEDQPITFNVLDNDIQTNLLTPDGFADTMFVTGARLLTETGDGGVEIVNGGFTWTATGQFTYTPNPDFNGWEFIEYTISDKNGHTDTARAEIFVQPVNDAPETVIDAPVLFMFEDDQVEVLLNDLVRDIDGDGIRFGLVGDSSEGFATLTNADGEIISAPADISVVPATSSMDNTDTLLRYMAPANFSNMEVLRDAEGAPILDAGGSLQYALAEGASPLTVTYAFREGHAHSSTTQQQTIQILVAPVNDAPMTEADAYALDLGGSDATLAFNPLENDTDLEGDGFTLVALEHDRTEMTLRSPVDTVFPASAGGVPQSEITFEEAGAAVFTPNAAYDRLRAGDSAVEHWTYTVEEAQGARRTETVAFALTGATDDPVRGVGDSFRVNIDVPTSTGFLSSIQDSYVFGNVLANDVATDYLPALQLDFPQFETALGASVSVDAARGDIRYVTHGLLDMGVPIAPGEVLIDTFAYTARDLTSSAPAYQAEVAMVLVGAGGRTTPEIVVSRQHVTAQEGGADDSFWVALATAPTGDVVIGLTSSDTGDFIAGAEQLIFTPENWQAAQQVTVTAVDDNIVDGTRTGTLTLATTPATTDPFAGGLSPVTVDVTTRDRDAAPELLVTERLVLVEEGGADDLFLVSLGQRPSGPVTVRLSVDDPTAIGLSADLLTFTPQNWFTPQEIRVTAVDDTFVEGITLANITVDIDSAPQDFASAASVAMIALVGDDDVLPPPPVVGITADTATVLEGDSGATQVTFTLTRSGADLLAASTVHYSLSPAAGSTIAAEDFAGAFPTTGSVTFLENETSKTLGFAIAGDLEDELDEAFTVTLDRIINGTLDPAATTARMTVANDDTPPLAQDDTGIETPEDTPVTIDVLANDAARAPGRSLTITEVTQGTLGRVEIAPDGLSVIYTPQDDATGADSFGYTVSDGVRARSATASVTVTPVNDAPEARDVVFAAPLPSDTAVADLFASSGLPLSGFATDVDSPLDRTSFTLLGASVDGLPVGDLAQIGLSRDADTGIISFDPTGVAAFTGLARGAEAAITLDVSVSDGALSDTGTVSFAVAGVNVAPVILSDGTFSVAEGETFVGQILYADPDDPIEDIRFDHGGSEANFFRIDSLGNLSFLAPMDFDDPIDFTDGDGIYEIFVELRDPFGGEAVLPVFVTVTEAATDAPPEAPSILGSAASDTLQGSAAAEVIQSLGGAYDKIWGGPGADTFVFGTETANGLRERDVIFDFEVGTDSILLTDGASVASVREGTGQIVVFLQGDGDAIYVRGPGVTADTITILTDDPLAVV